MWRRLDRLKRRGRRLLTHTEAAFLVYRYRYLAAFTLIGFLSIVLELVIIRYGLPVKWPWMAKAVLGFLAGLVFSYALNATLNYRVPRPYLLATFARFSLVSLLSFGLNMAAVGLGRFWLGPVYGPARLVSAGALFLLAYALHRRFTFDRARNFGIAVYASATERVYHIFHKVGRSCDHIHVDLVDETMNPSCDPVDLGRLEVVRRLWRGVPVALHVMSRRPAHWAEAAWAHVDWFLFHVNVDDDLMQLITECRLRGKKVGVVWHESSPPVTLLPYLPHVDFVMVLGIAQPGRSGQPISEAAVHVAAVLDSLRGRYGFEVMFDGSVNTETIPRIRATYVVAASAVLRAQDPVTAINRLKTGLKYERRAA